MDTGTLRWGTRTAGLVSKMERTAVDTELLTWSEPDRGALGATGDSPWEILLIFCVRFYSMVGHERRYRTVRSEDLTDQSRLSKLSVEVVLPGGLSVEVV